MGNNLNCGNICIVRQEEKISEEVLERFSEHEVIPNAKAAKHIKRLDDQIDQKFLAQFKEIVEKDGHLIVPETFFFSQTSQIALDKRDSLSPISDLSKYLPTERFYVDEYVFFQKESTLYKGEWSKEGKMNGEGLLIVKDKGIYEGTLRNGKIDGFGRFINLEGDYYEGEFKNDKANGYGIFNFRNEMTYEGYWINDLQQGKGKETNINGTCYEGDFEKGDKHGYAVVKFDDGSQYSGQICHNEMSGHGKIKLPNGKTYEGHFKANKFDGHGTFDYGNGKKYVGSFKNDKKHGFGKFFESEDEWYEGYWMNKHLEGRAVIHKGGNDFEVYFRKGVMIKGDIEKISIELEVEV